MKSYVKDQSSGQGSVSKNGSGNKSKILAVIPARGGSKGILKKNIRLLDSKPLLAYAVDSARQSRFVDHLVISTDDEDIIGLGRELGVDIPFKRPSYLAADKSPLISVVRHAYEYFKERGVQYNAILSIQPTCPFLRYDTIDRVIGLWLATRCESVVTVSEITKGHPYIAKRLQADNSIEEFCKIPSGAIVGPRQKREKAYYLTGGIYLRDSRLIENVEATGHALGMDARAVVVDELEAVDINNEIDLKYAEFLIASGYLKNANSSL
ncbi:MAG: acylneuraminate cytidylyltransferase family protein [Deltaproteobacteria bacterium]|nr:acylneuraminate cytidylyltransferase family protein [Deltaproteobacteria bacterium]